MQGFMRLIGSEVSGTGILRLQSDELLGMIMQGPTTSGVGDCHVYEDNAQGKEVAHVHQGRTIVGPFEHQSKRLYYVIVGTGVTVDFYAWKNAEIRRDSF